MNKSNSSNMDKTLAPNNNPINPPMFPIIIKRKLMK